jgi:hypothetical protein
MRTPSHKPEPAVPLHVIAMIAGGLIGVAAAFLTQDYQRIVHYLRVITN